jgi:hypothetical protein
LDKSLRILTNTGVESPYARIAPINGVIITNKVSIHA